MTRKELNIEYQKYLLDTNRYRRQLFSLEIIESKSPKEVKEFFKEKGLKECTRCGMIKPVDEHGKSAKCKRCETFIRDQQKKIQAEKDPEFKLRLKLKPYNYTPEEYVKLEELANNKCQLCGKEFKDDKDKHLDHCHKSKKVRGLLCTECNLGLGLFEDSIVNLKRAMEYL